MTDDLQPWARQAAPKLRYKQWYAVEDAVAESVGYIAADRGYEFEECVALVAYRYEVADSLTVHERRLLRQGGPGPRGGDRLWRLDLIGEHCDVTDFGRAILDALKPPRQDDAGKILRVGDRVKWLSWGLGAIVEGFTPRCVRISLESEGRRVTVRADNLRKLDESDPEGSS